MHERSWDGQDDQGRPALLGALEVRLIHHGLRYRWEGVIGNSSARFTGSQLHKAFLPPASLAIDGDVAYYAAGYNEGQPGLHGFLLAEPASNTQPLPSTDAFVSYSMIAVDSQRVYWANTGGMSLTTFIAALDRSTRLPIVFSGGRAVCLNRRPNSAQCYEDQDYKSVLDLQTDPNDVPTGLAVQRNGRVLAVARGGRGAIRLFDKHSGGPLGEVVVPMANAALNQLAMTPSGDLWVISGRSVLRFTDLEGKPTIAATISGLTRPVALATHPTRDDVLWVADGGESQQLKQFNLQGVPGPVVGRPGGYAKEPTVLPDKLCFSAQPGKEQTAIGVQPDGAVWAVDRCNNRMLRFRAIDGRAWHSDAQIAYLPHSYLSTVDHGNPRRVFANFLEFEVDGRAPLQPGDGAWRLVRNWLAGLPASLSDDGSKNIGWGGLTTVETLANGRTYGLLQAQGRQVIVELPAAGPLRVVRTFAMPLPRATARVMYENGDLGYALTGPSTQTVLRLPLTGFDDAGDPVWAREPVKLAVVPLQKGSPHYRGAFSGMPPRFPVTEAGRVVFFDQSVEGNEGFHLGAALRGGTDWLWQASPTAALDGKGSFQTKAIDRSINYGGNAVWAHGRHIVYGYHGEFYKDFQNGRVGQANQFMHFDESGLFLGQFGVSSTRATIAAQEGLSGNAFSPTLVRDGFNLYLYHNDESAHGGVHRWRIDGWQKLGDLRGSGPAGGVITLR